MLGLVWLHLSLINRIAEAPRSPSCGSERQLERKESFNVSMPTDSAPPFIETVVHPTDLSPASERAFAHALAVALVRRARLTILHVAPDDRPDWDEFPAVRATLERWGLLEPGSSRGAVFDRLGV